jgi:hypothetical protein
MVKGRKKKEQRKGRRKEGTKDDFAFASSIRVVVKPAASSLP